MARLLPGESPDEAKRRIVRERRLRERHHRLGALKRRLVPERPKKPYTRGK